MLGAVLLVAPVSPPAQAAAPPDRLDRFRELTTGIDPSEDRVLGEVYALLDGEIAESLAGGGVFASPEFVGERLEAFAETWGGLTARLLPLERTMAAAFSFTELPRGSTVRFYARSGGRSVPLTVLAEDGWPHVRPLPPGPRGVRQILVVWEGPPAPDGARAVRFDVVREDTEGARVAWSSSAIAPEGLAARWYVVRGTEIAVRHQARYPGWTPGCDGQTEYEDVYRLPRGASAFARVSRRDINGWHRDVHAAAERLFSALARGDRAALGLLVPDGSLRARLPSGLRSEPACDGLPGRDGTAFIAAAAGERAPWTLTFGRAAGSWRLSVAAPMVP